MRGHPFIKGSSHGCDDDARSLVTDRTAQRYNKVGGWQRVIVWYSIEGSGWMSTGFASEQWKADLVAQTDAL